jgi:DNA repair exonuclease SbcCD ATPase subunit
MRIATTTAVALIVVATGASGCNRQKSATEEVRNDAENIAEVRDRDQAELEKRVADLEQRWTEMESRVQEKNRTPTVALRDEVKEDVAAARQAVANLKTTTPDNWWERHEAATARTLDDIEADVRRFVPNTRTTVVEPAEPVGTASSFDRRRAEFVDRARARIDALESQLKDVKASGPRETELEDTRARIDKLQDDLERLKTVDVDEWWTLSEKRVGEYIDRVERSIGRLDNDKAASAP